MTNQNALTIKKLLFIQFVPRIINITYRNNEKNIVKDIQIINL